MTAARPRNRSDAVLLSAASATLTTEVITNAWIPMFKMQTTAPRMICISFGPCNSDCGVAASSVLTIERTAEETIGKSGR